MFLEHRCLCFPPLKGKLLEKRMPPPPPYISNNYSRVLESEHGVESMSKISLIAPFVVHYYETNENWHMRLKHKISLKPFYDTRDAIYTICTDAVHGTRE